VSDLRATRARQLHRAVSDLTAQRSTAVAERNAIVLALRAEDPSRWSYAALAAAVGCSRELIANIVQAHQGRNRPPEQ